VGVSGESGRNLGCAANLQGHFTDGSQIKP